MTNDHKRIDLIVQNNTNLRPPEEVIIEAVRADLFPDQRRVRITVEITPFREQPNLEIGIFNQHGQVIASSNAIGLMHTQTTYVLHLRGIEDPAGTYAVRVALYYEDQPVQATHEATFIIPATDPSLDTQ